MKLHYSFTELTKAMGAESLLKSNGLDATLYMNVRSHLSGADSLSLVHRLEVDADDSDEAAKLLSQHGLMGSAAG